MSLLIKGLDMPKLDENEEHLWVPGWIEVGKDGKAIFCTGTHFDPNTIHSYAVEEVPTHGRLIDADAHIKLLKENHCGERCRRNHNCFSCGIDMYIRIVENEPTIIEAEVSQ